MLVGSMFAGMGGICSGFKTAGAKIAWANEIDHFACASYQKNFGAKYLVEGDIRDIDISSISDFDILAAGFPCQPFSIMGKQEGFADPRGTMYFEILRVIDSKMPPILFLENVKNLLAHDSGRTFKTISKTLSERGYAIKHAVLSPHTHANIPQYRDRIFIVGFLDHKLAARFSFPRGLRLTKKINDIVTRNEKAHEIYYYTPSSRYYESLMKRMTDNEAIYRIDDSGTAMRDWRICPTLKANMGTYHDRVPLVRDCQGVRKLTVAECLAFQGFPKAYRFPNIPLNEVYKQLGNTVCVSVVERIAREIMSAVTTA